MTSLLVENHAIKNILRKHELPTQMQEISSLRKIEWKNKVRVAIEKSNTQRLLDECHKYEQGEKIRKTKTAHIVDAIMSTGYQRAISNELLKCNRTETKAIMIARFRMLECGKNFKGTQSAICSVCSIRHSHYEQPFYSASQGIQTALEASCEPKKVISNFLY